MVKKLTLLLVMICMMFSTAYAYDLTQTINNNSIVSTVQAGKRVVIRYTDMEGYIFNRWVATGITL